MTDILEVLEKAIKFMAMVGGFLFFILVSFGFLDDMSSICRNEPTLCEDNRK